MLIALVALAIGMTASAQYGPGRPGGHHYGPGNYRPNPGYGRGYGYGYFDGGTFEFGITLNHFNTRDRNGITPFRPDRVGFFGEYRVDLGPYVDMGLQLSTTFGKGSYSSFEEPFSPDSQYWQGAPLVVTDVNMLPYSGFNPYFGIGIGPGVGYEKSEFNDRGTWTQALVLTPRAGVELFECLRMSVQYYWYMNTHKYSYCAFGISWAFGSGMGGRRPMRR